MRFKCPICGLILYRSLRFHLKCCMHGEFRLNHRTGKLEPLKNNKKEDLPFKRSFKDGDSQRRFQKVLDENSAKVERDFRANHGDDCPSPFKN